MHGCGGWLGLVPLAIEVIEWRSRADSGPHTPCAATLKRPWSHMTAIVDMEGGHTRARSAAHRAKKRTLTVR
eukprot:scaffold11323_cov111-Isochrysis_galbana.AAC.4